MDPHTVPFAVFPQRCSLLPQESLSVPSEPMSFRQHLCITSRSHVKTTQDDEDIDQHTADHHITYKSHDYTHHHT
ncbi:hypothetical protein CF326_g9663 [Tilletia indica]|nr:hypothetical protein CF326_g9663 [Tilletia indica]